MCFLEATQREFQPLTQVAFDYPRINKSRQILEYAMVRVNVNMVVRFRPDETPDEGERFGHKFGAIHSGLPLHNSTDFAKGGAHLRTSGHVLVCCVCDEDIPELVSPWTFVQCVRTYLSGTSRFSFATWAATSSLWLTT